MSTQNCTYKGYECLVDGDMFFITYAGMRLGFGQVSVQAESYDAMDLSTPGSLAFANDDNTSVTLQNISCVKSVVVERDIDGAPVIYTLILTDAKYFWRKKYISARFNIQLNNCSDFYDVTKKPPLPGVPYSRAEILFAINAAGNITGAAYVNALTAETIEPMNVVFDNLDCLSAMRIMLEECQGYFAYDTVNNALKLINFGDTNAATLTKITDNEADLDAEYSCGKKITKKEAVFIPGSVDVVFSIYDTTQGNDFNDTDDRLTVVNSVSGRPASFNANIKHTIYVQNFKMVRVGGVFARAADMAAEANKLANDYYGRFHEGAEYTFTRAIDFNIDEVVTGIMWESTNGEDTLPMMTRIRTYNFDAFTLNESKLAVEKIVHETLYCEVDKTDARYLIKNKSDVLPGNCSVYLSGDQTIDNLLGMVIETVVHFNIENYDVQDEYDPTGVAGHQWQFKAKNAGGYLVTAVLQFRHDFTLANEGVVIGRIYKNAGGIPVCQAETYEHYNVTLGDPEFYHQTVIVSAELELAVDDLIDVRFLSAPPWVIAMYLAGGLEKTYMVIRQVWK